MQCAAGDSSNTACAIAKECGILPADSYPTIGLPDELKPLSATQTVDSSVFSSLKGTYARYCLLAALSLSAMCLLLLRFAIVQNVKLSEQCGGENGVRHTLEGCVGYFIHGVSGKRQGKTMQGVCGVRRASAC